MADDIKHILVSVCIKINFSYPMADDIKHILVSVCIKVNFSYPMADNFTKRKIPQETRLNIDNFFIYNFTFLDICT